MPWYARIEDALHIDRKKPGAAAKTEKMAQKVAAEIETWFIKTFPGQDIPKIAPVPDSTFVRVDCSESVGRQLCHVKGVERAIQSDTPMRALWSELSPH